jgi:hypothetical protein
MPSEPISFRKAVIEAFARHGFGTDGHGASLQSPEVRILVQPGRGATTSQVSISVGFWLFAIGPTAPQAFNHCHIYGGLRSLVPQAGDAAEGFARRADDWIATVDRVALIGRARLNELLTLADLRTAHSAGLFANCLVLREAKELLAPSK